jgi:hypothetical protein
VEQEQEVDRPPAPALDQVRRVLQPAGGDQFADLGQRGQQFEGDRRLGAAPSSVCFSAGTGSSVITVPRMVRGPSSAAAVATSCVSACSSRSAW